MNTRRPTSTRDPRGGLRTRLDGDQLDRYGPVTITTPTGDTHVRAAYSEDEQAAIIAEGEANARYGALRRAKQAKAAG